MARWLAWLTAVLALAATLPAAALASRPDTSDQAKADKALQKVKDLRKGIGVRTGRELTPALADLAARRSALDPAGKKQADTILARPTDAADPQGDSYSVPEATPVCTAHFCVHYVTSTADAPDLTDGSDAGSTPDYVDAMANAFESQVFACENGNPAVDMTACGGRPALGWPLPLSDGTVGGNSKTDVYIKDVGGQGIYGYAAPDPQPASATQLFAYLVMDNDYDPSQFPSYSDPLPPMEVTAAHEYNHVLQFGIDAIEDTWMLESTATYAEDKVYPAINDYLGYIDPTWISSLADPLTDANGGGGLKEYGSAVWNHWLAGRYGDDAVLGAWQARTPPPGDTGSFAPGSYSTAIAANGGVGFSDEFVRFAAATTEWSQTGQGFPDTYSDLPRSSLMAVDGANPNVTGLDHTTYRLRDITASAGTVPLTLRGTLPTGLDGGIALVGRTTGGAVIKDVKTTTSGGIQTVTLPAGNYARITAVFANSDVSQNGWGQSDWKWTADKKSITAVTLTSGSPPPDPTATTTAATGVSQTDATLNGAIDPKGQATGFYFEYGTTTSYGAEAPVPRGSAGSGSGSTSVSTAITGLTPGTTYHFRVVAEGVNGAIFGGDQTFTTAAAPTTTTTPTTTATTTTSDTTATPAQPSTQTPTTPVALVLRLLVTRSKLAAVIKNGLKARATCSATCSVSVKVLLSRKAAKRLHLKRTVATAKSVGGTTLKLRVSKRASKVLARLRSVPVTVTATATTADGQKTTRSKRLTLRR